MTNEIKVTIKVQAGAHTHEVAINTGTLIFAERLIGVIDDKDVLDFIKGIEDRVARIEGEKLTASRNKIDNL